MTSAYADYILSPALVLILLCTFFLSGGCFAHVDLFCILDGFCTVIRF
jgi:hypothetical protein